MDSGTLDRRKRIVVGALMLATLAFALIFLQQQFDQGDYRKALLMLAAKAPGARWSIGQELVERSGSTLPDCQAKLVSQFAGTLEITCVAGESQPYRFSVDLVRNALVPADPRTRELVQAVEHKNASPLDAGAPARDGGAPE